MAVKSAKCSINHSILLHNFTLHFSDHLFSVYCNINFNSWPVCIKHHIFHSSGTHKPRSLLMLDLFIVFPIASSLDIDECAEGKHYCRENTMCVNTPGSFMCICHTGYIRIDDYSCTGELLRLDLVGKSAAAIVCMAQRISYCASGSFHCVCREIKR